MTKWLKNSISFRYFLPWLMVTLADVFAVLLSYAFHFSLGWAICFFFHDQLYFPVFFPEKRHQKGTFNPTGKFIQNGAPVSSGSVSGKWTDWYAGGCDTAGNAECRYASGF